MASAKNVRRRRGGRVWGGSVPAPTAYAPQQNFLIFELKMASFGASWKLILLQSNTIYLSLFTFTYRSYWVSSDNDSASAGGSFSRHLCVKKWGDFCLTVPT